MCCSRIPGGRKATASCPGCLGRQSPSAAQLWAKMAAAMGPQSWLVAMKAGEMKAFAGFSLGTFAPRKGKRAECRPDDGFRQAAPNSTTLQACFLECQKERRCENVFLEHVDVAWLKPVPPIACTLLGAVAEPARACKAGTGTLVKKLPARPLIGDPLPQPA